MATQEWIRKTLRRTQPWLTTSTSTTDPLTDQFCFKWFFGRKWKQKQSWWTGWPPRPWIHCQINFDFILTDLCLHVRHYWLARIWVLLTLGIPVTILTKPKTRASAITVASAQAVLNMFGKNHANGAVAVLTAEPSWAERIFLGPSLNHNSVFENMS